MREESFSLFAADFLKKSDEKTEKDGNITIEKREEGENFVTTLFFPFPFSASDENLIKTKIKAQLLEKMGEEIKKITVVGIGNASITADSLGPKSCEKIIATRELGERIKKEISVIKTEVFAKTGIYANEYVEAIVKKIGSQAVIVIDSLAAKSTKRLYKALQIGNTGILPGSAIKKQGRRINQKNLKIPVITLGVPTVVDMRVLAKEITGKNIRGQKGMVVTPAAGDICIEKLSSLIADAINEFTFGF